MTVGALDPVGNALPPTCPVNGMLALTVVVPEFWNRLDPTTVKSLVLESLEVVIVAVPVTPGA